MAETARGWVAAALAFLAAFLASSHHWLHMLLISLGLGFGATAALFDPTVRRAMLVVSVVMTALIAWWMLRHPARGLATMAGLAASIAISIGLVAYTVIVHGW